jgi:Putative S-adenosyl-L-methionine-dependent methyltransferase
MKSSLEYDRRVATAIDEFEESITPLENSTTPRQVFHTPTELFKPFYGYAIARYILHQYRSHYYPRTNLCIYEIGGGNGTLMMNLLDYIYEHDPQVYAFMQYRVVEISQKLAQRQKRTLEESKYANDHLQRVEIIQQDILTWSLPEQQPAYILAMEVIDNLPHDVIRYDPQTGQPFQGVVLIDPDGEFEEAYTPSIDELPKRYLALRHNSGYSHLPLSHPQGMPAVLRQLMQLVSYRGKLTSREFIPTALLSLLDVLDEYFPHHHLILSDFEKLPNSIPGYMAPVVQTRYQKTMVPCTTYLVRQGYFDIFFPTDFEELRRMYEALCPSYFGRRQTKVLSHRRFVEKWGDLEGTSTKNGDNPMRDYYQNVKMLIS